MQDHVSQVSAPSHSCVISGDLTARPRGTFHYCCGPVASDDHRSQAQLVGCTAREVARDVVAAFSTRIPVTCTFYIGRDGRGREPDGSCGGHIACTEGRVRNGFVATADELKRR